MSGSWGTGGLQLRSMSPSSGDNVPKAKSPMGQKLVQSDQ